MLGINLKKKKKFLTIELEQHCLLLFFNKGRISEAHIN